jgi:RNA-directed DNA polymerase
MTVSAAARAVVGGGVVNGPEDGLPEWTAIDWRGAAEDVRRLRQRIFTASKAGDLAKVRNLQKLMLRSRANTLVSVRRVTELNAGRKTAGIDGQIAVTDNDKRSLTRWIERESTGWRAWPVKRVMIPKANGKQRGLGIPVLVDRVLQARVVNALEPEWEARFEPRSYGFRPGRGCQDAIGTIYLTVNGKNPHRLWVLDADLTAAFDHIDHQHLLTMIGTFPARGMIRDWLRAGVVDKGRFAPTEEGTPQGGVASPLLFNIALHGMEQAAGVRYQKLATDDIRLARDSPALIRYADDLVVLSHSREQAEQVKARLAVWLTPRGLAFNEDKTHIVHVEEHGFDFLGFTVRRYHGKLLIMPSKTAVRRIRLRLRAEMLALRGANAQAVLYAINPIVRGWSAYYRTVVSSRVFNSLDDYMWKLTYKWAKHSHPNKPKNWIVKRYFGKFNPSRQDKWVFGHRDSGAYLRKFCWTKIIRHQLVSGTSSPDDPTLADYWATRRRRKSPPIDHAALRLLRAQHGRCPLCRDFLLHADQEPQSPQEWEQWLRVTRRATTKNYLVVHQGHGTPADLHQRLLHTRCYRQHTAGNSPAHAPTRDPAGLA